MKLYKYMLIVFIVYLLGITNNIKAFSLLNKNNKFDEIKSDFIKNLEQNKLVTYMKKNKLKVNR